MQEILDRLFQLTPDLPPKLRQAAKLILDDPAQVALKSMRNLAKSAGVAPPTMMRLAKQLGFENWDDFRFVFQQSFTHKNYHDRATGLTALAKTQGQNVLFETLALSAHENVRRFFDSVIAEDLNLAADIILSAPQTYVIGAGSAHWMSAYMQYVSSIATPNMRAPRANGNDLVEGLIRITDQDCMIVITTYPYAKKPLEAAQFAKNKGARLICITDSRASPVAAIADVLILCASDYPQFFPSMVGVMSAIETLISLIVSRGGDDIIAAIAEQVALRDRIGVYIPG